MEKLRNERGCLMLDNFEVLENNYKEGRKQKLWLKDKSGTKYLFKYGASNYEIYAELIAEQLGRQCGIDMAEYQLATFNGRIGVASKNFVNFDEYIIGGDRLFRSVQEVMEQNNMDTDLKENSVSNIVHAMCLYDEKLNPAELTYELMKRWSFYMLIMESDKNKTNWSILKSRNGIRLAPDYDNSTMARLNENIDDLMRTLRTPGDIYRLTDDIKFDMLLNNDGADTFMKAYNIFCEKYPLQSKEIIENQQKIDVDLAIKTVEDNMNENNTGKKIEVPSNVKYWVNLLINTRQKDMEAIHRNTMRLNKILKKED